ncbi:MULTISPECIES: MaoC/PaaZ C-terminal domain-containing protein [Sphingobium]|uniref:Dehydratase n=1 Tax=Sphingobium cupriresistens TaxID=1132417 RepID=A0A8G2DYA8_9SPHN|nr:MULTISPECIES: MaoC/PaaZ C-terminal domain-containing protein [Sphingobium]MBJ7376946.1 MaoC family dehydratase N-terminal domain-containing protein [Sphingobium sp.]RYM11996.1 dehydratase [Sphingobium cupriresistens]
MLNLDRLRAFAVPAAEDICDPRSAILYALGVGAGLGAIDEQHLLFERDLEVLPTMALVLGTPGFWPMAGELGWDWPRILHGEQSLRLLRPLELGQLVHGRIEIGDVADKGPGKAALVRAKRTLMTPTDLVIAEMEEIWVLRGAGGFGGPRDLPGQMATTMPDEPAHALLDLPTAINQALLYRLTGDRNPLHVDAGTAASAGFDRPVLHGLATMGLVSRALVHLCCGGQAALLTGMSARFTAPVWPGETVRTEIWRDGDNILFRASIPDRSVVVMDGGRACVAGF